MPLQVDWQNTQENFRSGLMARLMEALFSWSVCNVGEVRCSFQSLRGRGLVNILSTSASTQYKRPPSLIGCGSLPDANSRQILDFDRFPSFVRSFETVRYLGPLIAQLLV